MSIPIDSLLKLPALASYSMKNGQANATVSRDERNIIVYASCDSLQQLVTKYELECSRYKQRNDELKKQSEDYKKNVSECRSNTIKMLIFSFISGVIFGIVLTIIFKKAKYLWDSKQQAVTEKEPT